VHLVVVLLFCLFAQTQETLPLKTLQDSMVEAQKNSE
jgi:hypothetical protein